MVQDPKKRVSAFAVQKAMQGKHKLDDSVSSVLASKVQKLHDDVKFNKAASKIASNYERNLSSATRKKARKIKERKEAIKQYKEQQKKQQHANKEQTIPEEKPLNWYGAPKSDKRVKVKAANAESATDKKSPKGGQKESTSSTGKLSQNKQKQQRAKAQINEGAGDQANGKVPGLVSIIPSSNGKKSSKNNTKPTSVTTNKIPKTNSKKVTVEEWVPPSRKAAKKNGKASSSREDDPSYNVADIQSHHKENRSKGVKGKDSRQYSDEEDGLADDDSEVDESEHENPEQVAKDLFAKLIHPHNPQTFFKKNWLKKPMHISRGDKSYYEEDNWFSTSELDRILTEERVRFGVNIDLTTFKDGKRETHNPAGRAYPSIVWDNYQQGCSVRLLNPQTYTGEVWYLLSTLQELFGCMVGANIYLTPPGTQGFAPHYDDIEGFVLQLEGSKRWRVYGPRTDADIWPLTSSRNMTEAELGKPVLDCVLQPGDLLYFPRGAIHQAMAQDDQHSLHITVSTHQKNSWSDLLNQMVPAALQNATENDPEFRESLPNDYLNYTGIAFQEEDNPARITFMKKVQKLMDKLLSFAPVDAACDMMAKKFIHDSLPPCLDMMERCHSVAEQGEKWVDGKVRDIVELAPETRVRLLRKHSLRIVNEPPTEEERQQHDRKASKVASVEDGSDPSEDVDESDDGATGIKVYFNTDNDRLYHGNDIQYFEIEGELAPGIEYLQLSFPEFISVEDIPVEGLENKLDVAMMLYDRGLLLTESPLSSTSVEESDDSAEFSSDGPSEGEDIDISEGEEGELDGTGSEEDGEWYEGLDGDVVSEGEDDSEGDNRSDDEEENGWFDDEAEEVEEGEESENGDSDPE